MRERAAPGSDANQREPGLGPVRLSERIEILDVLRGWALFGVFLCNMRWFSGYADDADLWTNAVDKLAVLLVDYAADDKFYSLFSFLFGLGFALQIIRAQARNAPFVRVYDVSHRGPLTSNTLAVMKTPSANAAATTSAVYGRFIGVPLLMP
jgi:uncharacterized membrane protein YeiB